MKIDVIIQERSENEEFWLGKSRRGVPIRIRTSERIEAEVAKSTMPYAVLTVHVHAKEYNDCMHGIGLYSKPAIKGLTVECFETEVALLATLKF
jgi:hypothetical protein